MVGIVFCEKKTLPSSVSLSGPLTSLYLWQAPYLIMGMRGSLTKTWDLSRWGAARDVHGYKEGAVKCCALGEGEPLDDN